MMAETFCKSSLHLMDMVTSERKQKKARRITHRAFGIMKRNQCITVKRREAVPLAVLIVAL